MAAVHFDPDLGSGLRKSYVWALGLIGLFLLLTACVNFVNMATAQALNRAREVGVRKAIGSSRGQLFWQFMSETGLIVLFSTVIGLATAYLALPALNALIDTNLSLHGTNAMAFYGFLIALMIAVAFLSGAYPGLAMSGFRPVESASGWWKDNVGGFSLRRFAGRDTVRDFPGTHYRSGDGDRTNGIHPKSRSGFSARRHRGCALARAL
ncbi:MAG: FtsX-like permease family protein [Lewinellaceae bacterium]|nr:FtsX-like permease family protein [Lewinellaceae bacterium]